MTKLHPVTARPKLPKGSPTVKQLLTRPPDLLELCLKIGETPPLIKIKEKGEQNDKRNNDKERTKAARSSRSQGTTTQVVCERGRYCLHSFEECLL
jgi:hypothetical protein